MYSKSTDQTSVAEKVLQQQKLDDIIGMLLSAGYFRARISTLTPFDKVVFLVPVVACRCPSALAATTSRRLPQGAPRAAASASLPCSARLMISPPLVRAGCWRHVLELDLHRHSRRRERVLRRQPEPRPKDVRPGPLPARLRWARGGFLSPEAAVEASMCS